MEGEGEEAAGRAPAVAEEIMVAETANKIKHLLSRTPSALPCVPATRNELGLMQTQKKPEG